MLYAIIDRFKGEKHGIDSRLHRLCSNGRKMVVNENELRLIDEDINAAAELLGGSVTSEMDVLQTLKIQQI